MNWKYMRHVSWLDTRARFVAGVPRDGALVDLGTADGETLSHVAELRPDLRLCAVDKGGLPRQLPAGCQFHRLDLEQEALPLPDASVDAVTCIHLVEHLQHLDLVLREIFRVLKPGGRAFFETPHPKTVTLSSAEGDAAGNFPMNFYDDLTHVRVVAVGALAHLVRGAGLQVVTSGISRNWLFAASYPLWFFARPGRRKFTARLHWIGWSAYLIASRS